MGKKKRTNQDEDKLGQFYLTSCCATDAIRLSFSFLTFCSKCRLYHTINNERGKSAFIDQIVASAVRVDCNQKVFFEYFVEGICLKQCCLCHLYGFS